MSKNAAVERKKFLVVSYDTSEQQWFYDHVLASSPESAKAFVCDNRPYVVDADATDIDELQRMAALLSNQTAVTVLKGMVELAKQHAEEEDTPYVPTNYWDASGKLVDRI